MGRYQFSMVSLFMSGKENSADYSDLTVRERLRCLSVASGSSSSNRVLFTFAVATYRSFRSGKWQKSWHMFHRNTNPPFPYLVHEVVLMGRTPHLGGVFGITRRDRMIATDALDTLGIADLAERPYSQLSGGQRQMVLMARAIAQNTPLMFLDEPTSALDFQNQMRIWKIMRTVVENGRTVIACSHDPNHVAWFCDRVVVVGNCGVIADGSPIEAINEQTLDLIYQNTCTVQTAGGIRIVMPADLQTRKAGKMQENSYNQHIEQNVIRRTDYDLGCDKLEQ